MSRINKILAVDDEPHCVTLNCALLEAAGYLCLSATSLHSAIDTLRRNLDIQLIVTDHRIGDGNSSELLKWLVEQKRAMPVIVVSGYIAEARRLCGHLPFLFLEKPLNPEVLVDLVAVGLKIHSGIDKDRLLDDFVSGWHDLEKGQQATRSFSGGKRRFDALKQAIGHKPKPKDEDGIDYETVLAAAVHDMKGELLHVASATDSLRGIVSPSSEVFEEIDVIDRSLSYCKGILRRILNLLELGGSPPTKIAISELLYEVQRFVRPRLPSSIQLHVSPSACVKNACIMADKEQLTSIFIELCMNAAKAISANAGLIEISVNERGKNVEFAIEDNGPGIAPALVPKLFHHQVASSKGAGLGLYLSTRLIQALNGELTIVSSSSKGTKLLITLPVFA